MIYHHMYMMSQLNLGTSHPLPPSVSGWGQICPGSLPKHLSLHSPCFWGCIQAQILLKKCLPLLHRGFNQALVCLIIIDSAKYLCWWRSPNNLYLSEQHFLEYSNFKYSFQIILCVLLRLCVTVVLSCKVYGCVPWTGGGSRIGGAVTGKISWPTLAFSVPVTSSLDF